MDTLCGDCEEKEFRHYYSFPHPDRWFWYCKCLGKELVEHSGVRKDAMCPRGNAGRLKIPSRKEDS